MGIVALLMAYAVRVRIFMVMDEDETAAPLLDDTFVTTFSDLLWILLYRRKHRIDPRYHRLVSMYFWLTIAAIALLIGAGFIHLITS